jgi:hypothetical protein
MKRLVLGMLTLLMGKEKNRHEKYRQK